MNLHKEMGANKKNIIEINPNIYKEAIEKWDTMEEIIDIT